MQAILALLIRSLRLEMRSKWAFWTRMGILAGMLILAGFIAERRSWMVSEAPGLDIFKIFIVADTVALLFLTCAIFGTAITEEKEDGTLPLMRMSDLSPLAILLGKGVSRMITAILFILVQIPFTMLAISLGGVGLSQIVAAYLILLAFLLFAAGHAILWSVIFRKSPSAVICTAVSEGFILLVGSFQNLGSSLISANWPIDSVAVVETIVSYFSHLNPLVTLWNVFLTRFTLHDIWPSVSLMAGTGTLLFLVAWAIFDICTASDGEEVAKRRRVRRPRRTWRWPFAWNSYMFIVRGWPGLCVRVCLCAAAIGYFVVPEYWESTLTRDFLGSCCFWVGIWAGALELWGVACALIWREVQAKTLSSILVIPRTPGSILWGKFIGTLPGFIPALILAIVGLFLIPRHWVISLQREWDSVAIFGVQIILIAVAILYASARTRILPYIWVMIFLAGTIAEWTIMTLMQRGRAPTAPSLSLAIPAIIIMLILLPSAFEKAGEREN